MKRVLVVDDFPDWRLLGSEYLRVCFGCSVALAENVQQARELLAESKFDLVISDYEMPGESGLDLVEHIRSSFPDTKFILMTGGSAWRSHPSANTDLYVVEKPQLRTLVQLIKKIMGWEIISSPTDWGSNG